MYFSCVCGEESDLLVLLLFHVEGPLLAQFLKYVPQGFMLASFFFPLEYNYQVSYIKNTDSSGFSVYLEET